MVFPPLTRGFEDVPASSKTRRYARVLLPLTCLLSGSLLGCDDDSDSSGLPGELGSNHFFYGCAVPADDVQCREDQDSFPDFIAVGARFELASNHELGSSLFIKPASPLLVSSASGEFQFLRPGFSAFLALDGSDKLKDLVHLEAVPVDEIQVEGSFGQRVTQVSLAPGREMTLIAVPLGDGEELAGTLSFRWATDDENVVRIPRRGTEIRLEALSEGTARVRVELDDVETTLQVTVTEAPIEPSDASTPNDAQADANAPDGAADAALGDGAIPLDASTPSDANVPSDAGQSPSTSTNSGSGQSTIADASTPVDASVAADAQAQTEAGDQ